MPIQDYSVSVSDSDYDSSSSSSSSDSEEEPTSVPSNPYMNPEEEKKDDGLSDQLAKLTFGPKVLSMEFNPRPQ